MKNQFLLNKICIRILQKGLDPFGSGSTTLIWSKYILHILDLNNYKNNGWELNLRSETSSDSYLHSAGSMDKKSDQKTRNHNSIYLLYYDRSLKVIIITEMSRKDFQVNSTY